MSLHLKQTFEAAVLTQLYPRSQIDIYVKVPTLALLLHRRLIFGDALPDFNSRNALESFIWLVKEILFVYL